MEMKKWNYDHTMTDQSAQLTHMSLKFSVQLQATSATGANTSSFGLSKATEKVFSAATNFPFSEHSDNGSFLRPVPPVTQTQ
tara:strand:- start:3 stop:248 length:246 start_codon:yes stop_codon:yes gene_type:complete